MTTLFHARFASRDRVPALAPWTVGARWTAQPLRLGRDPLRAGSCTDAKPKAKPRLNSADRSAWSMPLPYDYEEMAHACVRGGGVRRASCETPA